MSAVGLEPESESATAASARRGLAKTSEPPRFGPVLALWMALTVLIHGGLWIAGFRTSALSAAVEHGAARAEALSLGEVGDDLIRKTIRTQHETLSFWTVLAFLGDFLGEPLALATRAVAAATAFGAIAALRGRVVGYDRALADCAAAQGFWVLGMAVQAALMVVLRRNDVETSAVLLLPPGGYSAVAWIGMRQLEAFALVGWSVVGLGACRRGQVGWPGAVGVVSVLALSEASVRLGLGLGMGAAMRLSLVPA
jgi:hypothetical protein